MQLWLFNELLYIEEGFNLSMKYNTFGLIINVGKYELINIGLDRLELLILIGIALLIVLKKVIKK